MPQPDDSLRAQLDVFFASLQAKVFAHAHLITGDSGSALILVQDAMFEFSIYDLSDQKSWRLMFLRVFQDELINWCRHRKMSENVSGRHFVKIGEKPVKSKKGANKGVEPLRMYDVYKLTPPPVRHIDELQSPFNIALKGMPDRQLHAFLMCKWWGMGHSEAAFVLRCSEGVIRLNVSEALRQLATARGLNPEEYA